MKFYFGLILTFILFSCAPETAKKLSSGCGANEEFSETKRVCIQSTKPKIVIANNLSYSFNENIAEARYPITYTKVDTDNPTSCTIASNSAGFVGVLKSQGIIFRANTNDVNGSLYRIVLQDDGAVTPGSEFAVWINAFEIAIHIRSGISLSHDIISAFNVVANPTLSASLSQAFVVQNASSDLLRGGYCECTGGICEMIARPREDFFGSSYIDYYLTEVDGNSDTKRISFNVSNVDTAPVTAAVSGISFLEDTSHVVTLSYTDIDDGRDTDADGTITAADSLAALATSCSISNINSNIFQVSSCTCTLGVCSVSIQGQSNYFTSPVVDFNLFDFTVSSHGLTSNTSTAAGSVTAVEDAPVVVAFSDSLVEDTAKIITLPYSDAENDLATSCTISSLDANLTVSTACACDGAGVCTVEITPILNFNTTTTFNYFSYSVTTTGGPLTSNIVAVSGVVTAVNDIPTFAASPTTVSGNESNDWNPATIAVVLDAASDVDLPAQTISYFLTDAAGVIITDGSSTNGVIANCLNLTGSTGLDDLTCTYTPLDGNYTGTETFYYKAYDGVDYSVVQQLDITILGVSDVPTICYVSQYEPSIGRVECGKDECVGEGAPLMLPISHVSTNPVSYYDKTNGVCYVSNSTSAWTKTSSYLPNIKVGEKEKIIIKNIIINEGGDSSEDGESMNVDLTSASEVSVTNSILLNKANINFRFDYNNDIDFIDGLDEEFNAASGITEALDGAADDASFGRLRLEILPSSGQVGTSQVSINVNDDAGTPNKTSVTFSLEVLPISVIHKGWAKVESIGIKVDRYSQPLEKKSTCTYSLDKCNNGAACVSTSTSAPTASADFKGAIYKTSNKCYVATDVGKSSWTEFAPFCNITEVKRYNANSISKCTYSLSSCDSGGACISSATGTPNGSVSADSVGAIFRDGAGNCYNSTATGNSSWTQVYTSLDADLNDGAISTCDTDLGSASCVAEAIDADFDGYFSAAEINTILPAATNNGVYFYNSASTALDQNKCWFNNAGTWTPYSSTTEIKVGWETFTVSGTASISGYNIYRKVTGEAFNYERPLNKTLISSFVTEYTDNGDNSHTPPTSNRVYFYEVRPVLFDGTNTIVSSTNSNLAKLRVVSPPDNTVFAHRWMMNKKICSQIGSTSSIELGYLCDYIGPVDATVPAEYSTYPSTYVYDVGSDLIVNRFEMGCPYATSGCNTTDGTCIDTRIPDGTDGEDGDFFYNRTNGVCSYNNGGTWGDVNSSIAITAATELSSGLGQNAFLPPLTNIGNAYATTSCIASSSGPFAMVIDGVAGAITKALPSRKQQIAYSQWNITASFTDSDATFYEEGLALNSLSKCNSSNASGLTFGYTDDQLPDSNTFYSIPGMASNSIRSVYTGSSQTRNCVSMFGVQDSIGNVGEWLSDQFTLSGNTFTTAFSSADAGSDFNNYRLNEATMTGPCADTGCTVFMNNAGAIWKIEDTALYNSTRLDVASGLPVSGTIDPTDSAFPYMLEIGTGVSVASIRDDTINTNMGTYVGASNMVSGGGYSLGGASGVYNFELVGEATASRNDIGFRCVAPIPYSNYTE